MERRQIMKRIVFASAIALCAMVGGARSETAIPAAWMNPSLAPDARAAILLAAMSQDEKLVLIRGYFGVDYRLNPAAPPVPDDIRKELPGSAGFVPGIPRLGIPSQRESDASLGVANGLHMRPGDEATAFPASLLTAGTWNPVLAYELGAALGRETHAKGFNVLLAGGVNLARDPRNGRNFEYAGEDPLLAGTMVGEAIRGVQDQYVISTIKHFAVNDQETGRSWLSSNIDEAAMRESDLLAFQIAIERGKPGSVMCAYNRVNGVYACEHDFLLNKVLKGDWKYPGYVMSDWGGMHSTVAAANGGVDQESAHEFDRGDYFGAGLRQALTDGAVTPARVDDMARRILRSMFAAGLFDHPAVRQPIDVEKSAAVAQRVAEEGIVLLKNQGDLLPLTSRARRIAVIGGRADIGVLSGGGSSQVIPFGNKPEHEFPIGGNFSNKDAYGPNSRLIERQIYDPPSPLSAIRKEAKGGTVIFDDGADPAKAAALARRSDVVIVFAQQWLHEGYDTADMALSHGQNVLIDAVASANPRTVVVLETGNPVAMPWLAKVDAVLAAWYPGSRGAAALARILFGKVNPSGHLAISIPAAENDLPRPVVPGIDVWTQQRPVHFDVDYKEGADVGYRWYAAQKIAPLYPFGYGLSYTRFAFTALQPVPGDPLTLGFDVSNTGKRTGKSVAQLYVSTPALGMRLIGFAKTELKPGEVRHVAIIVDPRLLAKYDASAHMWRIAEGDYTIHLGASATQFTAQTVVHLAERSFGP
jgi:beta-glucosidase